jgi:hypothetical protein
MTTALHSTVLDRLLGDEKADPATVNLVDAACTGDAALSEALAKLDASEAPLPKAERNAARTDPPGVYLSRLKLAGFRGIGPEQTLQVTPGPGLTILIGRNGRHSDRDRRQRSRREARTAEREGACRLAADRGAIGSIGGTLGGAWAGCATSPLLLHRRSSCRS